MRRNFAKSERTIEDRLREEYFDLLPDIRRVVYQIETEIRHALLIMSKQQSGYERLDVTSRVKDCESAIRKLRGTHEGATFDAERPELYTLATLNDLAGVRVLVFPRRRIRQADVILRRAFSSFKPDHIQGNDEVLALKYRGLSKASRKIKGEYQIMSILNGRFWEVEHSAMYKPDARLRGVADHPALVERRTEVHQAIRTFEEQFERLLRGSKL